jgi:hypothetical protein
LFLCIDKWTLEKIITIRTKEDNTDLDNNIT